MTAVQTSLWYKFAVSSRQRRTAVTDFFLMNQKKIALHSHVNQGSILVFWAPNNDLSITFFHLIDFYFDL